MNRFRGRGRRVERRTFCGDAFFQMRGQPGRMLVADLGEIFILAWFFVTGSVLGSFLNVVIYRVPRGLSLVHPPSRCPVCLHPIRWHDNVPILGWFLLRGRCRDCGARIALRYPVVEALAGLDVLLVALKTGEWRWVPVLESLLWEGAIQPAVTDTAAFTGVSLSLLAAALILFDGARVPLSFWTTPMLLVLLAHLASLPAVKSATTPSPGPISNLTTTDRPQIPGESPVESRPRRVVVGIEKHMLSWVLALAGGMLADIWFTQTSRPKTTSKTRALNGPGLIKAIYARRFLKERPVSSEPKRTDVRGRPPYSGWEFSFACAICGWIFGRPTQTAVLISFLAAIAMIAVCIRKRLCRSSRTSQQRSESAATQATAMPNGDPLRIRSIPMFALWLFFLSWIIIR